jgi:hypothetical protein
MSKISDLSYVNNNICEIVSQKSICRKLGVCEYLHIGALPIYDTVLDKTYKYYNDCKIVSRSTRSTRIVLPLFDISTYKEIDITSKYCDVDEQIANDIIAQECELLLKLITYSTVIKNVCSDKIDYKLILNNDDMNNLFEDGYAISIDNLELFLFTIRQDIEAVPCDDPYNLKKGFACNEVVGMMMNNDIEINKFMELKINKFEILMGA